MQLCGHKNLSSALASLEIGSHLAKGIHVQFLFSHTTCFLTKGLEKSFCDFTGTILVLCEPFRTLVRCGSVVCACACVCSTLVLLCVVDAFTPVAVARSYDRHTAGQRRHQLISDDNYRFDSY